MGIVKNIFIDQGSTYNISLTATDYSGSIISLAGGTAAFTINAQLRKSPASSYYTSFSSSITGPTGQFTLTLSATASSAISPGKYMYDVEVINNSTGTVYRTHQGTALIDAEITK